MESRHAIWPANKKYPPRWRWGSTRPPVSGPPLSSPGSAIATWDTVPNGTPPIGEKWEFFFSFRFRFFICIFPISHLCVWYISAINVARLVFGSWLITGECELNAFTLSPSHLLPSVIKCSTSCGKGMRHRRVYCQGFDGRDVGESDCSATEKPSGSDICDMGSCSANTWFFTEWTGQVHTDSFSLSKKKHISGRRKSLLHHHNFLLLSLDYYYYQCSEECGTGIQTRKAHCSSNSEMDCDVSKKPDTSRTCVSAKDCSGKWFAGPWSQVFLFVRRLFFFFFLYRLTCFGMEAKTNRENAFSVLYIKRAYPYLSIFFNNLIFSSVRQRAMKELRLERSYVWLLWEASIESGWICSAQLEISPTTRLHATWANAFHSGTRPTGLRYDHSKIKWNFFSPSNLIVKIFNSITGYWFSLIYDQWSCHKRVSPFLWTWILHRLSIFFFLLKID